MGNKSRKDYPTKRSNPDMCYALGSRNKRRVAKKGKPTRADVLEFLKLADQPIRRFANIDPMSWFRREGK